MQHLHQCFIAELGHLFRREEAMAIESSRNPGAFCELEHDGWETVSVGYERHFARLTTQTVPAILDAAHVAEGMRVLDVSAPGRECSLERRWSEERRSSPSTSPAS